MSYSPRPMRSSIASFFLAGAALGAGGLAAAAADLVVAEADLLG